MEEVKKIIGEELYNNSFTSDDGIFFEYANTNEFCYWLNRLDIEERKNSEMWEKSTTQKYLVHNGEFVQEIPTFEMAKAIRKEIFIPFFMEFDRLYNETDWELGTLINKALKAYGKSVDLGNVDKFISKYLGVRFIQDNYNDWDKFQLLADEINN